MITLKSTYEDRKNEINKFIELIDFLEKKKIQVEENEISFDDFFYGKKLKITLSYQELINILKSNLSLMMYNIIEYTVSGLVDCIYDEIRVQQLSYIDVNESIRKLWRKTVLKSAKDPEANFNTFLRKNEEIIDCILEKKILDIHAKQSLPAGNLDGISIEETFRAHGIQIQTHSKNYRPDILSNIKTNRNNLAHGSVSFVDAVRGDSIQDFKNYARFIMSFLEELINTVEYYIKNGEYRIKYVHNDDVN